MESSRTGVADVSASSAFGAVADSVNDAIIAADEQGRIVFANRAAERLFARTHDELLGSPLETLMPERFRDLHRAGFDRVLSGGESKLVGRASVELSALRADGSEVPVELSLGSWQQGDERRFTGVLRDVTERHAAARELTAAHAELERRAGELERSNDDLERFASVASHDLQEPLRTVAGFAQLLAQRYEGRLDDDADVWIGHLVAGTGRMQALIADLLSWARVGSAGLAREPVDLGAVLAGVLEGLDATIAESGARLDVGELPTVPGDAGQLAQLFQNLVGNALKFYDAPPPEVSIAAERDDDGDGWRIAVADRGIGIPERDLERVFAMFGRLHSRDAYDGTGIGLALCLRIIENHAGTIGARPREGGGTVFEVWLPG